MKLIIGLGNPGKEYEGTRHNIGFRLIDDYDSELSWQEKFNGLVASKKYDNEKVFFFKPLTYMNNSGIAVSKIINFYNFDLKDVLIIHDDLDLEFGNYRIKYDSSSGGHNGIKSVIQYLNSQKFWQLKIGISKTQNNIRDYVTGKFTIAENNGLELLKDEFRNIIDCFIREGGEKTMSLYNQKRR